MTRHGYHGTPTYVSWRSMRRRCLTRTVPEYRSYGGRGITICSQWNSFKNFLSDMGERPKGMDLDRINNDGHYEPMNCRWATPQQQARNRRNTKLIVAFGESKALVNWAEDDRCAVSYSALQHRISSGWQAEEAISTSPNVIMPITAFKETKTLKEWAEDTRCVVRYWTLQSRLYRGWKPEHAITAPNEKMVKAAGEHNGKSKLTLTQVEKIRVLYKTDKCSFADLGRCFGVHRETIRNVVYKKTWADEAKADMEARGER